MTHIQMVSVRSAQSNTDNKERLIGKPTLAVRSCPQHQGSLSLCLESGSQTNVSIRSTALEGLNASALPGAPFCPGRIHRFLVGKENSNTG